jgi:geranylgeranyl transferase type-2 subunit alpha
MHGRLKVRSTAEQEEQRKLERQKKLAGYKALVARCLAKNQNNDVDDESLRLSEEILYGNPDVLTLWSIRKKTLVKYENEKTHDQLDKYYEHDIYVTEMGLRKNPKSYGSWSHRQWCLLKAEKLSLKCVNWQNELGLCNKYLNMDERNFHCWSYRQFVIKNGCISKFDELKYTYDRICTNFSNYSSWHYRSKLITDLYLQDTLSKDPDVFKNELELIENAVFTDPNDQAAWIYQKWLLLEHLNSNVKSIELNGNLRKFSFSFATSHLELPKDVVYFKLCNVEISKQTKWTKEGDAYLGCIENDEFVDGYLNPFTNSDHVKIEICLKNVGSLHLVLQRKCDAFEYKATLDRSNLKLDNELMLSHLKNIIDLSGLEMNKSKWCLLTLVQLMQALDYDAYKDEILSHLDKLANDVDSYRKNFYIQLKESFMREKKPCE